MPLTPPPRLNQTPPAAGGFIPSGPAAGDSDMDSQGPNLQTPQSSPDPGALADAKNILLITSAARQLAQKYPTAVPEVQQINDAVQKLQMKITQVQPPAQVAAPPQ